MSHAGGARPKRQLALEDCWRIRTIADVAAAPDGRIAYVVRSVSCERNERESRLWLLPPGAGAPLCLSPTGTFDDGPRWSPDGTLLAVSRHANTGAGERGFVELVDPLTGRRRTLAAGHSAVWSPASDALCFVSEVPVWDLHVAAEAAWYAQHPDARRSEPLRRMTSLRDRVNGAGYRDRRARLAMVGVPRPAAAGRTDDASALVREADTAGGLRGDGSARSSGIDASGGPETNAASTIPLTGAAVAVPITGDLADDVDDRDPAWSPDGRWIAFVSDRKSDTRIVAEQNLWLVETATGAVHRLTNGFWFFGPLAWSPDSRSIAALGMRGLHVPLAIRLWIVAADGSAAVAASEAIGAHIWPLGAPVWSPDGERVMIAAAFGAQGQLRAYEPRARQTQTLLRADAVFGLLALLPDRNSFAAAATTPTNPGMLVAGSVAGAALETLVDLNADWLAQVEPAAVSRVAFRAADDTEVDGWLVTPSTGGAPFPCITDVHYGPNAAWGPAFSLTAQAAAGRGFATLMLNPRGSTGFGDAFLEAADFGGEDFADLLCGIDALVERGLIDGDRLGIAGLSYGGFMAAWAIAHSPRFRAAVSINGISNQLSWHLISDTGLFFYKNVFGDPLADAAALQRYWKHSPLAYAASIETPLLLLQGEEDYRCPIDQGEQLFGALVSRGKTVEMIRVPGAAHDLLGTASPLHAHLAIDAIIGWFERFLPS